VAATSVSSTSATVSTTSPAGTTATGTTTATATTGPTGSSAATDGTETNRVGSTGTAPAANADPTSATGSTVTPLLTTTISSASPPAQASQSSAGGSTTVISIPPIVQTQIGCLAFCFGDSTTSAPTSDADVDPEALVQWLMSQIQIDPGSTFASLGSLLASVESQISYQTQIGVGSESSQTEIATQTASSSQQLELPPAVLAELEEGSTPLVSDSATQIIGQLQIGCLTHCQNTYQEQDAAQADSIMQSIGSDDDQSSSGAGASTTASDQIWQIQVGCVFWCLNTIEVQIATSPQGVSVVNGGPGPMSGDPSPTPTPPTPGDPSAGGSGESLGTAAPVSADPAAPPTTVGSPSPTIQPAHSGAVPPSRPKAPPDRTSVRAQGGPPSPGLRNGPLLRIVGILPRTGPRGVSVGTRGATSGPPVIRAQSIRTSSLAQVSEGSVHAGPESSSTTIVTQRLAAAPLHLHPQPSMSVLPASLLGLAQPSPARQPSLFAPLTQPTWLIGLGSIVGVMLAVTLLLGWKPRG
jgi:hypothetical protein